MKEYKFKPWDRGNRDLTIVSCLMIGVLSGMLYCVWGMPNHDDDMKLSKKMYEVGWAQGAYFGLLKGAGYETMTRVEEFKLDSAKTWSEIYDILNDR